MFQLTNILQPYSNRTTQSTFLLETVLKRTWTAFPVSRSRETATPMWTRGGTAQRARRREGPLTSCNQTTMRSWEWWCDWSALSRCLRQGQRAGSGRLCWGLRLPAEKRPKFRDTDNHRDTRTTAFRLLMRRHRRRSHLTQLREPGTAISSESSLAQFLRCLHKMSRWQQSLFLPFTTHIRQMSPNKTKLHVKEKLLLHWGVDARSLKLCSQQLRACPASSDQHHESKLLVLELLVRRWLKDSDEGWRQGLPYPRDLTLSTCWQLIPVLYLTYSCSNGSRHYSPPQALWTRERCTELTNCNRDVTAGGPCYRACSRNHFHC